MDDLLSEKEQLEQFRAWWKEYGAFIIGGVVIGAALLFGWNRYQDGILQAQLEASIAYESLVEQVLDGDLDEAEILAEKVQTNYAETAYAGQSGLAMARLYMDKNRDQDAAIALLSVVEGENGEELQHVARLRLARIYLYQDKAEAVVDLLAEQDIDAFAAAYGEVLGDAYTALGRFAEAEDAYQKVLMDPLSQGTVDQQLVQWKSLDLPEVQPAPDTAEPTVADPVETADPDAEVSE